MAIFVKEAAATHAQNQCEDERPNKGSVQNDNPTGAGGGTNPVCQVQQLRAELAAGNDDAKNETQHGTAKLTEPES